MWLSEKAFFSDYIDNYITSLKSSTDSFTSHPQVQIDISEYEKKGFQKRRPKEGSENKPV